MLLQSSLNEKKGPALYVCPDIQLSQQVASEAASIGLDVTTDPKDPDYLAGNRICIVNVYKLFNGRSVFGVGRSQIDIGTVIIDDAHACVSTTAQQFRITLPNTHEAYKTILASLSEDLEAYSEARWLDVEAGDPQAYLEVPFWVWDTHQTEVTRALHQHRNEDELTFTYPLLRDVLRQCRCVLGGQHLEIEPYFPPVDLVQSFRRAKRRIYMTATLADDSVIATHLGADPKSLDKPIVPSSSQSMGERMIVLPQELNPELTTGEVRDLLVELAESTNVVVIVPSRPAAEEWEVDADQVLIRDTIVEGIEKLRHSHVGLTVLVNRYDGIDLPGDACRVLAIADLPEVTSYADLVDSEILSGTKVNLRRQIERIEQGMGRGVRSNDDYCVVLLLGPKLTGRLRAPEGYSMLTPATKAQLDLSRKIARRLGTPSLEEVKSVAMQCLDRDAGWIKVSKKTLLNLQADDELRLDPAKIALRAAFDYARGNQHERSLATLDKVIDSTGDKEVKAWLLSKKAAFQHALDPDGAQRTLVAAHALEPSVTKPMHGSSYKKLAAATGQQAARLVDNHDGRFMDATARKLFADELCSDLRFRPDTSDKFEAAVHDLSWFLGIKGQRPEKDYREGPDNLWALPNGSFLVIECKNGVTNSEGISKKDAGQLGQSMAWFCERYPASTAVPLVIHPERKLGRGASNVAGMRVVDDPLLEKLRKNLRALAKQLSDPDVAKSASEVARRLAYFELSADSFVNAFSTGVKH